MRGSRFVLAVLASACTYEQPLDLPADPAAAGAKVGVRTFTAEGATFDVWYPTVDGVPGEVDVVDLTDFVPPEFVERLSEIEIPTFPQNAYRDAPVRNVGEPLPTVVFSHGLGGFRDQSVDLTTHLASRGYVVVSADHPGRRLYDVAPCLLDPPAGTCNLGALAASGDPGPEGVASILAWLETEPELLTEQGTLDLDRVGIFGHSMGGGTTTTVANTDDRIDAAFAMAGAGEFTTDVPTAVIGGSCDATVDEAGLKPSGATASEGYWSVTGAGHLAFSDLCRADLGPLAEQIGARDDANAFTLNFLGSLATDGCPGATPPANETCDAEAYLDLEVSYPILRAAVTVFFDEHLKGTGGGLSSLDFPELVPPQ